MTSTQQSPVAVPTQAPPPSPPPPTVVTPEPDSRLEQLSAEYEALKPHVKEVTERLETITKALKTELREAAPEGATEIVLRSRYMSTPYRLHPVESWRIDTERLKAQDPVTYARWAKPSTTWRLDRVK